MLHFLTSTLPAECTVNSNIMLTAAPEAAASIMHINVQNKSHCSLSISVWFISSFTQLVIYWLQQAFKPFPLMALKMSTVLLHTRDQLITVSVSDLEALSVSLAPWKMFWSVPRSTLWFPQEKLSFILSDSAYSQQKGSFQLSVCIWIFNRCAFLAGMFLSPDEHVVHILNKQSITALEKTVDELRSWQTVLN